MQNFQKFIVAEARNNGLSPERLGEAVHVAMSRLSGALREQGHYQEAEKLQRETETDAVMG